MWIFQFRVICRRATHLRISFRLSTWIFLYPLFCHLWISLHTVYHLSKQGHLGHASCCVPTFPHRSCHQAIRICLTLISHYSWTILCKYSHLQKWEHHRHAFCHPGIDPHTWRHQAIFQLLSHVVYLHTTLRRRGRRWRACRSRGHGLCRLAITLHRYLHQHVLTFPVH